jgi:transposase
MDAWKWLVGCAALWAIAGCQTPQAITALERECRMLEDQVYMLEDELSRSEAALEACQRRSDGAPRSSAAPPRETPSRSAPADDSTRLPPIRGPQVSPNHGNGRSPVDPRALRLPDVEVPGQPLPSGAFPSTLAPPFRQGPPSQASPPASPGGINGPIQPNGSPGLLPPNSRKPSAYRRGVNPPRRVPDPRLQAGREMPRRLPPPADNEVAGRNAVQVANASRDAKFDPRLVPAQAIALDPRADNKRVDRITLNRAVTGGYDRDSRFGDAGVTVLIEPRDVHGQLAPAAGPVSVVILDRGRTGDAARVARWDFTAEQTATLYRKTPYGEGIYLEMPWLGSPPDRSRLHMFVRYTTKDGRNLEASREVDVALPAQRQQAWTAITASASEPRPVQTASSWRQKPRREEEPAVRPAVAQEPISTDTSPAEIASAADPAPAASPKPAKPCRPVWSPLRPEG